MSNASIEIGDTFHAVAGPEGRDEQRVRTFGCMTFNLVSIARLMDKLLPSLDNLSDLND